MWTGQRLFRTLLILLSLSSSSLSAQTVLYCSPRSNRLLTVFEVAGKAGDRYWVHTVRKKHGARYNADPISTDEHGFDIYDNHMNLVNQVSYYGLPDNSIKQYYIPGESYFDRVMLLTGTNETMVFLDRYNPDGELQEQEKQVAVFPFSESGNQFLLIRSEDRNLLLLLGFEPVPGAAPRMHALLFNRNWELLSRRVYQHTSISQPFVQDDFTSYPVEHFSNEPVKLANNGQWLMANPSRTSHNFMLFHFCGADSNFTYKEMTIPPSSTLEEVAVSVNNEKEEAFAGILSTFHYSPLKNVLVAHYSLEQGSFDFDSSYRFNTQARTKVKDDNLVNENFITVPGKGFMLLKEYGRPYAWSYGYDEQSSSYDYGWDPELLFADNSIQHTTGPMPMVKNGYMRYDHLGDPGRPHGRGDLNLFFFPAARNDSTWSGMINQEQITELNTPSLSYLVMPSNGKLFFLYNSLWRNMDLYPSATIIDNRGYELAGEGIVFNKFRNILNFQESRQIDANEVAVAYNKLQGYGFAIIRL